MVVWRSGSAAAIAPATSRRRAGRRDRLATPAALALPRAGPLRPPARGDHAHHHRSCRGAAALGGAARALSPDLRDRLRAPAMAAPRLDAQGAAVRPHPAGPAVHLDSAVLGGTAAPPALPVRQRAGLPRRAGAAAAARRASDRVLFLAGARRRARRRVHRAARAAPVRWRVRVPDRVGCGLPAPPDASRPRAGRRAMDFIAADSRSAP